LHSRFDVGYKHQLHADGIAKFVTELRRCRSKLIILSSRSIFRWGPLGTTLRSFIYAFHAGPLYERSTFRGAPGGDLSASSLHLLATSPSASTAAAALQVAMTGSWPFLRQLASHALAADQLEVAIRADIAMNVLQHKPLQRYATRGS